MTAAIDFSDLTGVKPQQPKPQGFQTPPPQQNNAQGFYSPDKIPEQKAETKPASMGYPIQQTPAGERRIKVVMQGMFNILIDNQKIHLCLIDQS